jgi:hypothetical protein
MCDTDRDILRRIIETRGGFGHPQHIELAWTYLDRYDLDLAHEAVAGAIRHVAELHGAPDKYHQTITRAWVHLVAVHRAHSHAASFDEFIAGNAGLLDRHLLRRHYSRGRIASCEARAGWLAPDLRPLPELAA